MSDWHNDLECALRDGNPRFMQAVLARVPPDVKRTAAPVISHMARNSQREGKLDEALTYADQLVETDPENQKWRSQRAEILQQIQEQSPQPEPAPEAPQRLAHSSYDPRALEDGSALAADDAMVAGLREHLRQYSAHQRVKSALARFDDQAWLQAWDRALQDAVGKRVLFHGSELGLLPLRAIAHGAAAAVVCEPSSLEARLAAGVIQKNQLASWYERHGQEAQEWPQERKSESFASLARQVEVFAPGAPEPPPVQTCDWLVFPGIDHSLIGTGLLSAVQRYREQGLPAHARIFPGKARIFAVGVQWSYGTTFNLEALNDFRWSLYPQALALPREGWREITSPVELGEIDFAASAAELSWETRLPVQVAGRIDAVLYWFELELGSVRLSSAVDGKWASLRPAVQYVDSRAVESGTDLILDARLTTTRLQLQIRPASTQIRSAVLPDWYVPMILDEPRNEAYRETLRRAAAARRPDTVLDLGAGCGLLSMQAAEAGAPLVYACEVNPALCRTGEQVLALNGLQQSIRFINKDCRRLRVGEDLERRADLLVFEMFDCSLIGEGILHFLDYARTHLLTQGARFLPRAARIRAMLVEYRLDRQLGIDLTLLNAFRFSPSFINVDAQSLQHRPLSEPFEVFSFDFTQVGPAAARSTIQPVATGAGIAGAVLFWFELQLDETIWLSNDPRGGTGCHWKQGLQFLPEVRLSGATVPPLLAQHDGSQLSFRWEDGEGLRERLTSVPRFDPRSQQALTQLEFQTQQLVQHCVAHPEEAGKAGQVAMRFAADPAAAGVDPKVAERFAGLFLAE